MTIRPTLKLADQAEGIRVARGEGAKVIPLRQGNGGGGGGGVRTIAVTSGKGGVGKTQLSANLAISLARRGLAVGLFDADLGLASLDLALGVRPEADLRDVLSGERSIDEILIEGPANVRLVPACPGRYEMANLDARSRHQLREALDEIAERFDVLIVDTGAGIGSNAVAFAAWADEILLVATPDPTSLRDAYAMAKVLNRRKGVDRIRLVANQVWSEAEGAELHDRIDSIVRRFLTLDLSYLGCIPRDDVVGDAVLAGEPYVLSAPDSAAARAVTSLARRLDPATSPREMC